MPEYEFPAGLWALRQIDKEAKIQGATLTAHDKWQLKQPSQEYATQIELVKRTVSLIRSSITRAKTNSQTPLVTINNELTIPQDWFENYKYIYLSEERSLLTECIEKAFKGCPEWGETTSWISPDNKSEAPRVSNTAQESGSKVTSPNVYPTKNPAKGAASIFLGAISIFIALIGGAALAVPFGIYGISSARKQMKSDPSTTENSLPVIGLWLSIAGIVIAVLIFVTRLTQS